MDSKEAFNPKALYSLSYGVFVLSAHDGGRINACITNTCMQVAASPVRIAISVQTHTCTCRMIQSCKSFSLSILDTDCTFATIKHFGFQSGHTVDQFADFPYRLDRNRNPLLTSQTCAFLSARVVSSMDLGTHALFIAELEDAQITSSRPPITYADYQRDIKERVQVQAEKKIIGWRCKICGYEYMEAELPGDFICPQCQHPAEDFEPIYA